MLQEVHKSIREFARGDRSADSLREWIADNVQAVLKSGDEDAIAIVDELEALYAQLSENLITERAIMDVVTAAICAAETEYRPLVESLNGHAVVIESVATEPVRRIDHLIPGDLRAPAPA